MSIAVLNKYKHFFDDPINQLKRVLGLNHAFPLDPWDWYIFLHLAHFYGFHVGKIYQSHGSHGIYSISVFGSDGSDREPGDTCN